MTDTYNYAYDHTQENSYEVPRPPSYGMSIITQEQPSMPKPTVSPMETSPNIVKHTVVKSSSPPRIPLCRIFLIIVASFIIGGAVGGTFSYLLVTRQGPVEGPSIQNIQEPTSQYSTCPACPTCPTISATVTDPDRMEGSSGTLTTASNNCPTCTVCKTCPISGFPIDCTEVLERGIKTSGQYMISPLNSPAAFPVWCDMETDGGGWTVFQRRIDGSVDFYLGWTDYTIGFGNVSSEHWLGNQKIHQITSHGDYELRIDMADFDGITAYAKYSNFSLGGLDTNYVLTVGGYSGNVGDSLSNLNSHPFSTKDVDNDSYSGNCAIQFEGAWWYIDCHSSNLNGMYLRGSTTTYANGVVWATWRGQYYSLKVSVMKMRRVA